MEERFSKVILTQMMPVRRQEWTPLPKHTHKRLLRNTAFFAALSMCLGGCAWISIAQPQRTQAVMSHLTSGFEYDDTLGRLQFVSNMLPESAMVFLSSDDTENEFYLPAEAQITHPWTEYEPWLEYACIGDISACCEGEVVSIVANRQGEHTIRIIHENGYESIYSGLSSVSASEYDYIEAGEQVGTAAGNAAFELRKDGVSVHPVFAETQHAN